MSSEQRAASYRPKAESYGLVFVKMAVIIIPLFFAAFLATRYLFHITIHSEFDVQDIMVRSITLGLVAAAWMAYLGRGAVVSLPVSNKDAFLSYIEATCRRLGYCKVGDDNNTLVFRACRAAFLGFRLYIQISEQTATITGPSSIVQRMKSGLESSQQS